MSAYTAVSAGYARDGTPVFGFEASPAFAAEPVEFEFVYLADPTRFAVRTGNELVIVADAAAAERLCRSLVEYETYDLGIRFVGAGSEPAHLDKQESVAETADRSSRFDEITRHRLAEEAYAQLYKHYVKR
jgi:hypothetical protein